MLLQIIEQLFDFTFVKMSFCVRLYFLGWT